jgi:hypothetical protein
VTIVYQMVGPPDGQRARPERARGVGA